MRTYLFSFIVCLGSTICCQLLLADNMNKTDSTIDLSALPNVIRDLKLELYESNDSRICKILNEGIEVLEKDSIKGDYIELTISPCNHGTIVKVDKKFWTFQADDYSSITGYCRHNKQIVIIKGKHAYQFFKKSKKLESFSIKQYEPLELADYNPPTFLLPNSDYLRITHWGQLLPIITNK